MSPGRAALAGLLGALGVVALPRARGDAPPAWVAPAGVPRPGFGLDETLESSCAGCVRRRQQDLRGLGQIPAGTVVELEGGPFDAAGGLDIRGEGTAERPVFVRGPAPDRRARIRGPVRLRGSYLVVENLDIDLERSADGARIEGRHVVLRDSAVHGYRPGRNGTALFVAGSEDVLIRRVAVRDNGDFSAPGEQDVHGVGAGLSRRVFVLDSELHHNRGDGVQIGHRAANSVGPVYIARNDMHDNGENSIDIKEASDVVISENRLHHEPRGHPVVVLHYCPVNAAVLGNAIEDAEVGLSISSLLAACKPREPVDVFVLRNAFRRLTRRGIEAWGSGKRYHVAGNCFEDTPVRIKVQNAAPDSRISEGAGDLAGSLGSLTRVLERELPPTWSKPRSCAEAP